MTPSRKSSKSSGYETFVVRPRTRNQIQQLMSAPTNETPANDRERERSARSSANEKKKKTEPLQKNPSRPSTSESTRKRKKSPESSGPSKKSTSSPAKKSKKETSTRSTPKARHTTEKERPSSSKSGDEPPQKKSKPAEKPKEEKVKNPSSKETSSSNLSESQTGVTLPDQPVEHQKEVEKSVAALHQLSIRQPLPADVEIQTKINGSVATPQVDHQPPPQQQVEHQKNIDESADTLQRQQQPLPTHNGGNQQMMHGSVAIPQRQQLQTHNGGIQQMMHGSVAFPQRQPLPTHYGGIQQMMHGSAANPQSQQVYQWPAGGPDFPTFGNLLGNLELIHKSEQKEMMHLKSLHANIRQRTVVLASNHAESIIVRPHTTWSVPTAEELQQRMWAHCVHSSMSLLTPHYMEARRSADVDEELRSLKLKEKQVMNQLVGPPAQLSNAKNSTQPDQTPPLTSSMYMHLQQQLREIRRMIVEKEAAYRSTAEMEIKTDMAKTLLNLRHTYPPRPKPVLNPATYSEYQQLLHKSNGPSKTSLPLPPPNHSNPNSYVKEMPKEASMPSTSGTTTSYYNPSTSDAHCSTSYSKPNYG